MLKTKATTGFGAAKTVLRSKWSVLAVAGCSKSSNFFHEFQMEEIFVLKETGDTNSLNTPRDLFAQAEKINISHDQEHCIIFYLDSRGMILDQEVLFKGGLNACLIDPKVIFKNALLHNSSSLAMAHNHPSGNLKPSDADYRILRKLEDAGRILQIEIRDFLIFNKTQFYSCVCDEAGQ